LWADPPSFACSLGVSLFIGSIETAAFVSTAAAPHPVEFWAAKFAQDLGPLGAGAGADGTAGVAAGREDADVGGRVALSDLAGPGTTCWTSFTELG